MRHSFESRIRGFLRVALTVDATAATSASKIAPLVAEPTFDKACIVVVRSGLSWGIDGFLEVLILQSHALLHIEFCFNGGFESTDGGGV